MDNRFLDLLLRAPEDSEVSLDLFARGVRVGTGARLPRLPALYPPKKRWRPLAQADPLDDKDGATAGESAWRRPNVSVATLSEKVVAVMDHTGAGSEVCRKLKVTANSCTSKFRVGERSGKMSRTGCYGSRFV